MNDHPSISVIVPTYNRENSLLDCLVSVLAQDYLGQMEIIVVDQTPTHSQGVLDFFTRNRRMITRIEHQEPNLPKARNTGAAAAQGELLTFVDDDVFLPPYTLTSLARHFRGTTLKAVTGLVLSEADRNGSLRAYARQFGSTSVEEAQGPVRVGGFISALMMVSAKVVRAVGGFDPLLGLLTPTAYGEDDDFCCRLRRAGVPMWIDPSVRVVHRDHLAGGCGSRQTDTVQALQYHMKSMAYIRIKHHGRLGASGWLQLARAYLVNRKALWKGPGEVIKNFRIIRTALQEVKAFMAENGAEGPAHRALSARPLKLDSLNRQEP
jgi:GT2 family glycosyltransferase